MSQIRLNLTDHPNAAISRKARLPVRMGSLYRMMRAKRLIRKWTMRFGSEK
jgi:hypothetical protein